MPAGHDRDCDGVSFRRRADGVVGTAPGIALFSLPATDRRRSSDGTVTTRLGATAARRSDRPDHQQRSHPCGSFRAPRRRPDRLRRYPGRQRHTDATNFIQAVRDARGRVTHHRERSRLYSERAPWISSRRRWIFWRCLLDQCDGATAVFCVRVGVANTFGTVLSMTQEVAPGAALIATLTNSSGIGRTTVTTAGGAQARTVTDCARLVQFADDPWSRRRA